MQRMLQVGSLRMIVALEERGFAESLSRKSVPHHAKSVQEGTAVEWVPIVHQPKPVPILGIRAQPDWPQQPPLRHEPAHEHHDTYNQLGHHASHQPRLHLPPSALAIEDQMQGPQESGQSGHGNLRAAQGQQGPQQQAGEHDRQQAGESGPTQCSQRQAHHDNVPNHHRDARAVVHPTEPEHYGTQQAGASDMLQLPQQQQQQHDGMEQTPQNGPSMAHQQMRLPDGHTETAAGSMSDGRADHVVPASDEAPSSGSSKRASNREGGASSQDASADHYHIPGRPAGRPVDQSAPAAGHQPDRQAANRAPDAFSTYQQHLLGPGPIGALGDEHIAGNPEYAGESLGARGVRTPEHRAAVKALAANASSMDAAQEPDSPR